MGQQGQENGAAGAGNARIYGLELGFPRRGRPQAQAGANLNLAGIEPIQDQLQQLEQQIMAEIRALQVTQQELHLVQLLQVELARLRLIQNGGADPLAANFQMPQVPQLPQLPLPQMGPLGNGRIPSQYAPAQLARHVARPNTAAIPSGSADLPSGVTIPEGWSLLPLERLDGGAAIPQPTSVATPGPAANTGLAPTATTQSGTSPTSSTSNNTLTPTPTLDHEGHSQASSVDSSDTNAIHTPPSIAAQAPTTGDVQGSTGPATAVEGSSAARNDDETERRNDKGKAKAATVEDTVDEAEGA